MNSSIRNLNELGLVMQKIVKRLSVNQNLLKLLYYTDKDPFSQPDISEETYQREIFDKLIRVIPKVEAQEVANSILVLKIESGGVNSVNEEFLNIRGRIEIFIPLTQWKIKDSNLRPFSLLGEVQNTLNGKVVDGVGQLRCSDFELILLTDEISAYGLSFEFLQYV